MILQPGNNLSIGIDSGDNVEFSFSYVIKSIQPSMVSTTGNAKFSKEIIAASAYVIDIQSLSFKSLSGKSTITVFIGGVEFDSKVIQENGELYLDGDVFLISGLDIQPDLTVQSTESYQPIASKGIANGVLSAYQAALVVAADSLTDAQRAVFAPELEKLITSSAWPKLKELWLPLGSTKAGAYVKIKTATGSLSSIAEIAAATYTPSIGIIGDGVASRLNTGFNPTTAGVTSSDWGCGVYHMPLQNTVPTGVLGGTTTGTTNYVTVDTGGASINGTFITAIAAPFPGFVSIQIGGGQAQKWENWFKISQVASAGAMPNIAFTLLSAGGTFFSNARLGGWAAWSPSLTEQEFNDLSTFFRNVNKGIFRPVPGLTLTAAGDSNTLGLGVTSTERWPYIVSNALGIANNSGAEFNGGVNGKSSTDFVNTVAYRYTNVVRPNPALYVFMIGTNDCGFLVATGTYRANLINLMDSWVKGGINPKDILLMSPIWANHVNGAYVVNSGLLAPYTEIMREIASDYGTMFYDPLPLTGANYQTWYQADNLHLNATGHAGLAQEIINFISD